MPTDNKVPKRLPRVRLPRPRRRPAIGRALERFSRTATDWAGTSWAFGVALLVVVVWATTGPLFGFSDTWQLVINTGTTIVTFLMVFLIQNTQNRDTLALQLKLSELIIAMKGANNNLATIEDMTEEELEELHRHLCARTDALSKVLTTKRSKRP